MHSQSPSTQFPSVPRSGFVTVHKTRVMGTLRTVSGQVMGLVRGFFVDGEIQSGLSLVSGVLFLVPVILRLCPHKVVLVHGEATQPSRASVVL